MVVLKKALANYPVFDLGEWTWVLVRSEDWKLVLLARTLDPNIPALTDPAIRTTFFEEALVARVPGRLSELMAVWHMGREGLLDAAIRRELGHALARTASSARSALSGDIAAVSSRWPQSTCCLCRRPLDQIIFRFTASSTTSPE